MERPSKYQQELQKQIDDLKKSLDKSEREFNQKIEEIEKGYEAKIEEIEKKHLKKEKFLLESLKTKESLFQKELDLQIRIIKQSWSWRIAHLFIRPVLFLLSISRPFLRMYTRLKDRVMGFFSSRPLKKPDYLNEIQEYDFDHQVTNEDNTSLATVFDSFTENCFADEFNIIRFTPRNWEKVLNNTPVEGLFIESAWKGFGGAWRNKIVHLSSYNQNEIIKIIKWFKQRKLPTVFWNKEDPVHFSEFSSLAQMFDIIFTTDADCIPQYRSAAGHSNIYALPFAAQPSIHNPVREGPRDGMVCFAGTYYNKKYAERSLDLELLLKPALDFGLEIYDRNYGTAAQRAGIYSFPDIYQDRIKGRLDYPDMVRAYRNYKVFLNVNSVKYSPTMFARRVFELLACGTPVISTYSEGITELLGEDTVLITGSEADTRDHLQALLGDEDYWWKTSLNGIRKVMEAHTYNDRTAYIFDKVGLPFTKYSWAGFTVAIYVKPGDDLKSLANMLENQVYRDFKVIVIFNKDVPIRQEEEQEIKKLIKDKLLDIVPCDPARGLNTIPGLDQNEYVAFLHSECFYGKHYLQDYAMAVRYASPNKMGKAACFSLGNSGLELLNQGLEYTYVPLVGNASLVIHHSQLAGISADAVLNKPDFISENHDILSIDAFNFIQSAGPAKNKFEPFTGRVEI
jgi:spore maturation protein CgeB